MQRALEGEPQRGFADAGTTATLALWDPLGECLWCAWVGDTCALIVDLDDGTTQRLTAYEHRVEHVVSLSGSSTEDDTAEDDAPTAGGAVGAGDSERSSTRGANDSHFTAQAKSEQQRLARLGARYWCDRLLSPLGADDTIMLTRALGDRAFYAMDKQLMRERQPPYSSATLDHIRLTGDVRLPERYLVTPTPHVALCGLAAGRRYGLVLATDGVSDYVSDERLAELVLANAADPQAAAEAVVHEAKTARSRDNMSALVVVDLRQAWPACSGCQDRPQ
jgi:serine/threonine protein phosphatase PrpC